jgi:hypothetical protein
VFNEPIAVPMLVGEVASIPNKIKRVGAPLTFVTDGIGNPEQVTLVPYYKVAQRHYNMYWKIQKA